MPTYCLILVFVVSFFLNNCSTNTTVASNYVVLVTTWVCLAATEPIFCRTNHNTRVLMRNFNKSLENCLESIQCVFERQGDATLSTMDTKKQCLVLPVQRKKRNRSECFPLISQEDSAKCSMLQYTGISHKE